MKKIILFVLIMVVYSLSYAKIKIGIVDVNRVLANSLQIQNMQIKLQEQFTPRTQEIIGLQNNFLKDIEMYKQKNESMSKDVLQQERQKLIDENKKLQQVQTDFQRDVFTTRDQELRPILKQVEESVKRIAEEQKLDLVIARSNTVFNDPQTEITVPVIAEMGKRAR